MNQKPILVVLSLFILLVGAQSTLAAYSDTFATNTTANYALVRGFTNARAAIWDATGFMNGTTNGTGDSMLIPRVNSSLEMNYTNGENVTVIVRPRVLSNGDHAGVYLKTSNNTAAAPGYACVFRNSGTPDSTHVWFLNAGIAWVGSGAVTTWGNGGTLILRVQYNGSHFNCKEWANNSDEPAGWTISTAYTTAPGANLNWFGVMAEGATSSIETHVLNYSGYTAPLANGLDLSVNDTRSGTLVSGFSYNATNGTNTWSGYCAGTICSNTTFRMTGGTVAFSNISGYRFPVSRSGVTSNGSVNVVVVAQTFANSLTMNLTNSVNNSAINNFCGMINTTVSGCTVNGTLTLFGVIGTQTLTWYNVSGGTYFNASLPITNFNSSSANYTNTTSQGAILLNVTQLYTNALINFFTGTNAKTTGTTPNGSLALLANNGTNNIKIDVPGNFSKNITCTVPQPLQTTNCTATEFYDTVLNLTFRNAWSNASVSTFNGWVNVGGTNTTYSTTNGTYQFPSLQQTTQAYAEATGYSIGSDNLATLNPTAALINQLFSIYSNNSIRISIYNATSSALVLQTVTVQLIGLNDTYTNTTTNGLLLMENIKDGTYTAKFTSSGYSIGTYIVTVADRSSQVLNAYLYSAGGTVVVMSVSDLESGNLIQGASIGMYGSVNGTSQLIESHTSDVTGRAQFSYTAGTQYIFIVTYTGYNTNTFTLDPILFSSYDIKLRRTSSAVPGTDYATVSVYYTPKTFSANATNTFTWTIYSGNGTLQSYNMSILYPGGSYSGSGTSSGGEAFNTSFALTGTTPGDFVNVSYCYDTVYGAPHCFGPFSYSITGGYYPNTLAALAGNHYGMGLFERALIVTMAVLVVMGIVSMVGGVLAGGVAALLVMFFFISTGFVTFWVFIPSMIVGIFILLKGGI